MSDNGTIIAVVSTLLSSIALVGVAVGLILQLRQVQISQLQTARTSQFELFRVAMDNPELRPPDKWVTESNVYPQHAYLNLLFKHMELSYSVRAVSEVSVRIQIAALFVVEYRREWWRKAAREVYFTEAATRRERRFARIVDEEFQKAVFDADVGRKKISSP
jgi:hypothetical protein